MDMDMYKILAWLPGTEYFVATDSTGSMGWLTPNQFQVQGDWFLNAACAKYGYRRFRHPIEVSSLADVAKMAQALQQSDLLE